MNELITIIINVYNGEKFIRKCLDCIINQTYQNLEILVINDGSEDNTLKILKEYKDSRIKIITTKNLGLSMSRNIGIDNARGKYLYFIDVDDFICLDTIEYLYKLIKKYNVKMASCRPIDVFDYNINLTNKKEKIEILNSEEMLKKVLLSIDRAVTIWNKLIDKSLFNDIRFENRLMNDITVTYKLMIICDKVALSNQIKYYYLRHKKAITANEAKNIDRSIDKYNASLKRYNYIKNIYPNLKENDIGMIRVITMLYLLNNSKLEKYLDEQKALKLFKKLFCLKIFICKISFKEKIKILLLRINPKLCKYINRKYQLKHQKYKM